MCNIHLLATSQHQNIPLFELLIPQPQRASSLPLYNVAVQSSSAFFSGGQACCTESCNRRHVFAIEDHKPQDLTKIHRIGYLIDPALIAQLVERVTSNDEVAGSTPS
jgi:hypothetical protein